MRNGVYDVLVIGAGPGGGAAAKTLAEQGFSVLVVEKRQEVGAPVRCAEATGPREEIARYITPSDEWIMQDIHQAELITPGGRRIVKDMPCSGVILDRKRFDKALARAAAGAGAQVRVKTRARGLLFDNDRVVGARLNSCNGEQEVRARVVVGADGIESQVGLWAGINTRLDLHDVHSTVQYQVSDIDVPQHCLCFYFGSRVAPGGYCWVFPKADRIANVGVGIQVDRQNPKRAIDYLNEFIAEHYPQANVLEVMMGGVPGSGLLERISGDGFVLVGDAARQTNPLTGGGIMNALEGGAIAGEVIADALHKGDCSATALRKYDRRWHEWTGPLHRWHFRIRRLFLSLSDTELDTLGEVVARFLEKRSVPELSTVDTARLFFRIAVGLFRPLQNK